MDNITPEEVLERINKLDKNFIEVFMSLLTKQEWYNIENFDYDQHIKGDKNAAFTPDITRRDILKLTIFVDSKPEFIIKTINEIEEWIKKLKVENPTFYLLKKNYLNFKQNEERMIKIIKAMMD